MSAPTLPLSKYSEQDILNKIYNETANAIQTSSVSGGGGSGSSGGGGAATYFAKPTGVSGADAVSAYSSATALTVTGLSFAFVAADIVSVVQVPNAGGAETQTTTFSDLADFTVTGSAGSQTITVAAATFAATDTFLVTFASQIKGYNPVSNVNRSGEVFPLNQQFVEESLLDTTNVAAATNYYPASTGAPMAGYKDLSLTGKIIDSDNTTTMTLEGTNDEDTTNADWVQLYGYDTKNNALVNSIAAASTTTTFAWDFDEFNYRHFRVKLVTGDSTNTVIIKLRRKAL